MVRRSRIFIAGMGEKRRRAAPKRVSSAAYSSLVIGIDEVGRGALAGPVTVAAVAATANAKREIRISKFFSGIRDSKKLTSKQRKAWSARLRGETALRWTVASVSAKTIDRIGITEAANRAVAAALRKL